MSLVPPRPISASRASTFRPSTGRPAANSAGICETWRLILGPMDLLRLTHPSQFFELSPVDVSCFLVAFLEGFPLKYWNQRPKRVVPVFVLFLHDRWGWGIVGNLVCLPLAWHFMPNTKSSRISIWSSSGWSFLSKLLVGCMDRRRSARRIQRSHRTEGTYWRLTP